MANISAWSNSAGGNNAAPPDGWPEGQAASTVNNCARELMAAVRRQHEQAEWTDWGHAPTFVDANTFRVTGDHTAVYTVGRRIRIADSGTLYATITASAYSAPNTTVDVTTDSGNITNAVSAVAVSIVDPTHPSVAAAGISGSLAGSAIAIATDTTRGTVEFATDAETKTGTSTVLATTPANVAAVTGETFVIAVGSETAAITATTDKVKFRMPFAMTVTAVRISLTTAQASGSIFTVDIHESGTTILSTKLTIDNTEKTSTTAATAAVISDTALADDAEISIDVDQIGNGSATGLKVYIMGRRA